MEHAESAKPTQRHTIIVDHLDPELEDWQVLEYKSIAEECEADDMGFILSGLQSKSQTQQQLGLPSTSLTESSVKSLYSTSEQIQRVCLLDPKAELDLTPEDGEKFDVFLFGGILGDDPPRDRTSELRDLGFAGRRLGVEQMTTDTAARVTRRVVRSKTRLQDIPYINRPEIELPLSAGENALESVSMPFKYIKREDGTPVLPKGMVELLAKDANKGILDLL